jgi:hypothetical protein
MRAGSSNHRNAAAVERVLCDRARLSPLLASFMTCMTAFYCESLHLEEGVFATNHSLTPLILAHTMSVQGTPPSSALMLVRQMSGVSLEGAARWWLQ